MDPTVAGLLAAVVGVGGTLGSAWLTQRRGDASRREEWERLEGTRRAETAARRAESGREARRAAYTEFNAAARHYLATLNDHSHVLRTGYDPQESLATVEAARRGTAAGVRGGRRDRRGPRTVLGRRRGEHLERPPGVGAVLVP